MVVAIWHRGYWAIPAAAVLAACLCVITAGPLSSTALASSQGGRGAQIIRHDGIVVRVEVPANHRADARAGANARTERAKASVADPIDAAGSTILMFGVIDPIYMSYDIGLRHLDLSGLSKLSWPDGYTGRVGVRQDSHTLADEAIEGDTMTLYPPSGYVAFPAAPTVLTLTIYATSRFGTIMYNSWPFELTQP